MRVVCWLAVVLVSSVAAAGPSSPELGPGTIVDRVLVEVDIAPLEEVRILAITPAQLPPSRTRLLFDRVGVQSDAAVNDEDRAAKRQRLLCALEQLSAPKGASFDALKPEEKNALAQQVEELTTAKTCTALGRAANSAALKQLLIQRVESLLLEKDATHLEVEWDPAETRPLTRMAPLPPGLWQISLSAQPLDVQQSPFSNAAWSVLCPTFEVKPEIPQKKADAATTDDPKLHDWQEKRRSWRLDPDKSGKGARVLFQTHPDAKRAYPDCEPTVQPGWRAVPLAFQWVKRMTSEDLLTQFGTHGESRTPIGTVPRAFPIEVERLASDAFQAIADVAVIHAQQASLDVAKNVIVRHLCDEWAVALAERLSFTDIRGAPFSRSCDVLRSINPASLATMGTTLRKSLMADAMDLSVHLVGGRLQHCLGNHRTDRECGSLRTTPALVALAPSLGAVAAVVASGYFDSDGALPRAQALVAGIVQSVRPDEVGLHSRALVVLAYCYRAGSCDSNVIRNVLTTPAKFLETNLGDLRQSDHIGDMVSLVTHGLGVMNPRKGDDARAHVRNALRFSNDLVNLALQSSGCDGSSQCKATAKEVSRMFDVLFAVSDEDPVRLLVMLGGILAQVAGTELDSSGLAMLSAVASYAETYAAKDAGLTSEQQRERRAQAVAALADLAKKRELREGDWTLSFGAWIGVRGDVSWPGSSLPSAPAATGQVGIQLSLPVGLQLERRLSPDGGLWFGASFVDIGAYTRTTTCPVDSVTMAADPVCKPFNPSPLQALSFGLNFGFVLFNDFAAGLDVRYQPSDGASPRLSLGLSANYTLPLLWLK